ncbi:MAG: hypothetical protein QGG83_02560, partial [Candidatus Woesearchaeota archaeon]|nr:hypothetical protein [Candidatus Woesearchaeota archaeon]
MLGGNTMKKMLIALMCLLVLATSAAALQVPEGGTVAFGNNNQDRDVNATRTFTVTNEDANTTSVTVTSTLASKFKARFSPSNFSLIAGASQVVTATVFVPVDFDAVNDNLDETAFAIGAFQIKGTLGAGNDTTVSATLQAENRLRFSDGDVRISGSFSKTESIRD